MSSSSVESRGDGPRLRRMVRSAIGGQYLERSPHRDGWVMRDKEVEGRLVWRDDRPGYDVVVDGRRLTWEEFGDALEPFEGWTFRLSIRGIETAQQPALRCPVWMSRAAVAGVRLQPCQAAWSRRRCPTPARLPTGYRYRCQEQR